MESRTSIAARPSLILDGDTAASGAVAGSRVDSGAAAGGVLVPLELPLAVSEVVCDFFMKGILTQSPFLEPCFWGVVGVAGSVLAAMSSSVERGALLVCAIRDEFGAPAQILMVPDGERERGIVFQVPCNAQPSRPEFKDKT